MSLGIWQILLLVLLVLLLFGAGKLPHVMGDLAKGVKNFKKGLEEDDSDDDKEEDQKYLTSDKKPKATKTAKTKAKTKK